MLTRKVGESFGHLSVMSAMKLHGTIFCLMVGKSSVYMYGEFFMVRLGIEYFESDCEF
jgi:hypothetical protein